MSGLSHGITSVRGNFLPDKEFRSESPHIAMGSGPYLHVVCRSDVAGVWPLRIPGTATAGGDSSSRRCARSRLSHQRFDVTLPHHAHDRRELDEVVRFRRDQWMLFEKRNDADLEVREPPYLISAKRLSMVVVPGEPTDMTASEVPLQQGETLHAPLRLNDREGRLHLPADATRSIAEDRSAEASFAVDEADDPLRETWPFLLIVRTGRIVTVHVSNLESGCDMNEYRRMLGVSSK